MKKLLVLLLMAALCLLAAGCGEDDPPAPDELQTPQYSVAESPDLPEPEASEIHTAADGVKVIEPSGTSPKSDDVGQEADNSASPSDYRQIPEAVTPATVWEDDAVVTYNAFTLPEKAAFDDGSIGVLSIERFGLVVNVYESDDQMEDMGKGAAHFKSTSAWDGNVALSAHNRTASGYGAYFQDLHKLTAGDSIIYKTALGEREYIVSAVKTIGDEDWSALGRTVENRLTLITCVNDNAAKRLLVSAVQA